MKERFAKDKKPFIIGGCALLLVIAALIVWLLNRNDLTAIIMRLIYNEGTVTLSDESGADMALVDNMRLYSGHVLKTGADGTAKLGLDDTKIITVMNDSVVSFEKKNKALKLNLEGGGMYMNVEEKLPEDETFDISTSTMVVGIRGTSALIRSYDNALTLETGNLEPGISVTKGEDVDQAVNSLSKELGIQLTLGGNSVADLKKALEDLKERKALYGAVSENGLTALDAGKVRIRASVLMTDGSATITGTNDVTGNTDSITLSAGEQAFEFLYYDGRTEDVEFVKRKVTPEELPDVILKELAEDEGLLDRVSGETGWDKDTLMQLADTGAGMPEPGEEEADNTSSRMAKQLNLDPIESQDPLPLTTDEDILNDPPSGRTPRIIAALPLTAGGGAIAASLTVAPNPTTPNPTPADETPTDETPTDPTNPTPTDETPTDPTDPTPTDETPTDQTDPTPTDETPTDPADTTKPTISGVTNSASGGYSLGSVTLTASAADEGGLADAPYSWDGVNYTQDATYTATANGTYTVYVKDAAGNITTQEITVDNIASEQSQAVEASDFRRDTLSGSVTEEPCISNGYCYIPLSGEAPNYTIPGTGISVALDEAGANGPVLSVASAVNGNNEIVGVVDSGNVIPIGDGIPVPAQDEAGGSVPAMLTLDGDKFMLTSNGV